MSPAVQPDIAAGDVPIATEWPWSIAAARWPWARVQRCAGDAVTPGVVVPCAGAEVGEAVGRSDWPEHLAGAAGFRGIASCGSGITAERLSGGS